MESDVLAETIDTHTGGEPTRILVDGFERPWSQDASVAEKRDRFAAERDDLRELLMCEPRGHADMFGAVPTEPSDPDADLGLFFMDSRGYLDMCGHGTMGALTALIETDRLEPDATLLIETPAGLVHTTPAVVDGRVESVAIRNVESFVCEHVTVTLESGVDGDPMTIPVNLVYSGNVFALVDVEHVGLPVEPEHVSRFVDLGMALRRELNDTVTVTHPFTDAPEAVSIVEFYEPGGGAEGTDRNVVVFGNGQVDRSPCGTGTCAKMTLLHAESSLALEEPYRYESIIGSQFTGRLLEARTELGYTVTTPEVTGRASITGRHTFVLDDRDDLGAFSLAAPSGSR